MSNHPFFYGMKKKLFFISLVSLTFLSCTDYPEPLDEDAVAFPDSLDSTLKESIYTTASGKRWVLIEDKSLGNSISSVTVTTKNFEIVNDTYNFEELDPIEEVFQTDLDSNGFEELFFVTRSVGSGSYGTIFGIASNRDKSASLVYIYPVQQEEYKDDELFWGFRGHNTFEIEERSVISAFPVYLEGDSNSNPTGGGAKVYYELSMGEASWILKPTRREVID